MKLFGILFCASFISFAVSQNTLIDDFYAGKDVSDLQNPLTGSHPILKAAFSGDVSALLNAVRQGWSVHVTSQAGYKAIHLAAMAGKIETLQVLIELSVDINAPGPRGKTALHYVSEKCYVKGIEELVKAGADMNALDDQGSPPLYYLSKRSHSCDEETTDQMITKLIQAGADPEIVNNYGALALQTTNLGYEVEISYIEEVQTTVEVFDENETLLYRVKNAATAFLAENL